MSAAVLVVVSIPLFADPGDPDPTFGGGDGSETFDLGMDFEICAFDLATDGTAVLVLGTRDGSEIWTLAPDGTRVSHLKTYGFAGSPGCDQGLQDVICSPGTTTCYAGGFKSVGGDLDTWAVGFDWVSGLAVGTVLNRGDVVFDLLPGGRDVANAVAVYPESGEPQEVHLAGADGDFGASVVISSPSAPIDWNTTMLSGQPTELFEVAITGKTKLTQGRTKSTSTSKKSQFQPLMLAPPVVPRTALKDRGEAPVQVACNEARDAVNSFWRFVTGCGKPPLEGDNVQYVTLGEDRITLRTHETDYYIDVWSRDGRSVKTTQPGWTTTYPIRLVPLQKDRFGFLVRNGDVFIMLQYRITGPPEARSAVLIEDPSLGTSTEAREQPLKFLAKILSSDAPDNSRWLRRNVQAPPDFDTIVVIGRDAEGADANLVALRFEAPTGDCVARENVACLLGGQFQVTGVMETFDDPPQVVPTEVMTFTGGRAESDQAVFFESFQPGNFEVGVKMVDGCVFPEGYPLRAYWAFFGGLTNAETAITILDTVTLQVYEWFNPANVFPTTVGDTQAFPCDGGAPQTECTSDDETACLLGGRFRVRGTMKDFADPPQEFPTRVMTFEGDGRAESDQAVFFQSFQDGNFEAGVKMVDGCVFPEGHPLRAFWVFYGALTNAKTTLTTVQVSTGLVDEWTNPPGVFPTSVGRTDAFPCPESPASDPSP